MDLWAALKATLKPRLEWEFGSPFHIQFATPPPCLTTSWMLMGVERNSDAHSIKFDFPDPFGPIRTFSGPSSSSGVSGPKERISRGRSVLMRTDDSTDESAFGVFSALIS